MSQAKYINTTDVYEAMDELRAGATPEQRKIADYILSRLGKLDTVPSTDADGGLPPVSKKKTTVFHIHYADGRGSDDIRREKHIAWVCPICGWFVGSHRSTYVNENKKPCNFCTACGQRIDWTGIELGEGYDPPKPIPELAASRD